MDKDEAMLPAAKDGGDSSDDDIEIVPKSVDGFWLEDGDETPVSFATLPYTKTDEEAPTDKVVYVRGSQDNGMRMYARATAWKLELNAKDVKPVFYLKADKYWIQLLKPRKSYEETIRSIMSAAYFLNYALVNPDDSEKSVWSNINNLFPSWEVAPNRNDLASHLSVIQRLIMSDERLGAAAALHYIDTGISKKRPASAVEAPSVGDKKGVDVSDGEVDAQGEPEQKKGKFEVDNLNAGEEMDGYGDEDEDDVGDLSETVCCICDNGGSVICCDGPCMRSFHLNKGAGGAEDSHCSTLGFSKAEAERMEKFFCPNCKFKEHQCYACGRLGCSDDKAGAAQEVFVCDAAMCGHFYHPDCVAELISKDKDDSERSALVESIKEGNGFVCPMHKCFKCGKGEVKEDQDLQFGVCRRCPRVWHRKCLPFPVPGDESDEEEEEESDVPQRAWDNLLPNRILVYCERHPLITRLGTPARNHVKFPAAFLPSSKKVIVKNKTEKQEEKKRLIKVKKDVDSLKGAAGEKVARLQAHDGAKKKKLVGEARSSAKYKLEQGSSVDASAEGTVLVKSRNKVGLTAKQDFSLSTGKGEKVLKLERSNSLALKSPVSQESALRQQKTKPSAIKAIIISDDTKDMVNELIEKTKGLVTMESVLQKHDIPACYRRISKNPDKKYSLFKIESITKGMRKALQTLESGGSIEDAKAKCSPDFIRFIELCRNDLRVYLAPFLHGARYTSFGRHFTKSEKLEEIVDRLHWFIEKGDMIVDFCCGANEFSLFTRKKLEEMGKKCEYRNFDLIQTKNDFNFEKRDWFQVRPDQLPDGNRLIMGLNPPFGVKGHLANQFIDHALRFKPKLIILIVPKETERLDHKRDAYDLVWEDPDLLSGQSFYLPGSVDVDENPLNDWNVVAPPLSIWSRPDWTIRLRDIASSKGHISLSSGSRFVGPPWKPPSRPTSPSSLMDFMVGHNESIPAPVPMEIEEEIEDDIIPSQTRNVEKQVIMQDSRQVIMQDSRPILDRSSSAKLKDQIKQSREPSESKERASRAIDIPRKDASREPSESKERASRAIDIPRKDASRAIDTPRKDEISNTARETPKKEGSISARETPRKEGSNSAKAKPASKPVVKDTSVSTVNKAVVKDSNVPQKKQEDEGLESSDLFKKRDSEILVANQNSSKSEKKYDLFKKVTSEEKVTVQATENVDDPKSLSQKSPEKARRSTDAKNPIPRKDKKSKDQYNRGEGTRNKSGQDGHQWKRSNAEVDFSKSPNRRSHESHQNNAEEEKRGRRSPKRWPHAEADSSGRRSPKRHDIYDTNKRRSPNRYEMYESNRRSPVGYDRQVSGRYGEGRNKSPERARHTFLENEQKIVSPEKSNPSSVVDLSTFFSNSDARQDRARDFDDFGRKDYQSSIPYRGLSEESKRSWVDKESYQVGSSVSHLRPSEYTSAGLAKTGFQDTVPPYGLSSSGVQISSLGGHYIEPAVPGARRQDIYDAERSRLYQDPALQRNREFYQPELPREMGSVDRYGGRLLTESSYRGSGVGLLAERNAVPPWPAARASSNVYSSYESQLPSQPSLGDPSRISSHSLFDNRLVQTPNVQPYYPPQSQGRYVDRANQQFTGGWYND